jgi:hypothetical protein
MINTGFRAGEKGTGGEGDGVGGSDDGSDKVHVGSGILTLEGSLCPGEFDWTWFWGYTAGLLVLYPTATAVLEWSVVCS